MTVCVPRIWMLQGEAKDLPTKTTDDIVVVTRMQSLLPQDDNKLSWYFTDEAILVKAGLVYDKEFNPKAPSDPPSWSVDFNDMVSDWPTLFPRVAITSKTKPRASMIPASSSTTPLASGPSPPAPANPPTTTNSPSIPLAKIPSMLKRLAREPPPSGSQPIKQLKVSAPKKKVPQAPPRDSTEEVILLREESRVDPLSQHSIPQQTSIVDLDSSTTLSDHHEERDFLSNDTSISPPLSNQRPLDTAEAPPTVEESHRQRERKVIVAVQVPPYDDRYTPPKDPYEGFSHTAEYMNEVEVLRKVIATTNKLFDGAKKDMLAEREEHAKLSEALEERDQKMEAALADVKRLKEASVEAVKGWVVEKALQKEKEVALASAAAETKLARVDYQRTINDFLRSPTHSKKVGRECATYLTHVLSHHQVEYPDLVRIFEVEKETYPLWYEGCSLDPPVVG
ncbi:hypothetical protein LIER_15640 [Lithospermum erythrorhizon]|uniref:Uncharacterized protein n=1 Tax=Lithospermum erythrorhizon TaxID=34254 RepID=A0AAV3Q8Z6_LITER